MKRTLNVKTLLSAGALLAVALTGGNLAQAQTCSVNWTGNAGDGLWSNPSNWDTHKVPGPTSDVCIPTFGGVGATPPISVHSLTIQLGGSLYIEKGQAGATFSVATSLNNNGGAIFLYDQGTLSAGSIEMSSVDSNLIVYGNNTITSPAFSNSAGQVEVGDLGTLRLTDNPVQLQNGTLSGGSWLVDSGGVLIIPSDISQITGPGGASYTVFDVDGTASVLDTSGRNALTTLTSVGPHGVFSLFNNASLTVTQDLTSQGIVNAYGSLTIKGQLTLASGADWRNGTLTANSVIVQSGALLEGNGTVVSSITNESAVSVNGTLTVTGNYNQAAGASLTESFGSRLNVNSNATLSGALNVTVSGKHPPVSGAKYTAVTAGSLSGSFTKHTPGFTLTTNANSITVTKQ